MRRRSFTGPLILIVLGTLFLIWNLKPEVPLAEWLARYWPYALIAWGVLRLIEIGVWSLGSQPLPRVGLSGGEWALIILICLAGYGSDLAREHWPQTRLRMHGIEIFGQAYDFDTEGSQPAARVQRIVVENRHGNVRILGGDTQEVTVKARTTVRAFEKSDAETANRQCPLEVKAEGEQIVVRTNHERADKHKPISSDLDITIPRQVAVECKSESGDFDLSNIGADLTIESDTGTVRASDIGGRTRIKLRRSELVRVENSKGSVTLDVRGEDVEMTDIEGPVVIAGSYSGDLVLRNLADQFEFSSSRTEFRARKVPGQVRIRLSSLSGADLVGPVYLKTRTRDIEFADFTDELRVELDRGNIDLRPGKAPMARLDVSLGSGSINLVVPQNAGQMALHASVEHGDIVNEAGAGYRLTEKDRGAVLRSSQEGEPVLRLRTKRGTIVLRKDAGAGSVISSQGPKTPPAPPQVEQH